MSRDESIFNAFGSRRRRRRPARRADARRRTATPERLENRALLAITPTVVEPSIQFPGGGNILRIVYDAQSDQQAIIEIENNGRHYDGSNPYTAEINLYAPSNGSTVPSSWFYSNIAQIQVIVTNFNDLGVNNNALTIKGRAGKADRIILGGSGATAAGRWTSESEDQQCLLSIEGIDDLTLTAGGIINVSGSFTNNTNDAAIRAVGATPETAATQYTGLIVVGETTPVPEGGQQVSLYSNFIEIIGAEIDIQSDIVATDEVILSIATEAAANSLILPYDITLLGNDDSNAAGRLELHATKVISQTSGSTIIARQLVVTQRNEETGQGYFCELGSASNDFDTISLRSPAVYDDTLPEAGSLGRIGIRDVDDLTVADFGILAYTGQVRIDAAGALTFAAPVQASGLIVESDHSVTSSPGAIMRLGVFGIEIHANDTFVDPQTREITGSGDVSLAGPIVIDKLDAAGVRDTTLVTNKIQAAGRTTLTGGFYSRLAGITTITSDQGVEILEPVQVGSSQLNANSTTVTFFDHDLAVVSHGAGITVGDVPGNDAVVRTIQATGIVSLDAVDTITIAGSVFAGTIYGNITRLTATQALPAISVVGDADVIVTATGSLETRAFENAPATFANPLLGRVTINAVTQVDLQGAIRADGPVDVTSVGDIYLYGPVTAREAIDVVTTGGSIEVQGAVRSTGGVYTTAPTGAFAEQRMPNVTLAAPTGGIVTSGQGTLRAGTMAITTGNSTAYGLVRLDAQQDILLAADVDTDGGFQATTKLGTFGLHSLLRTGRGPTNGRGVKIVANGGISGGFLSLDPLDSGAEFGRIETGKLDLSITSFDPVVAADITLTGPGSRFDELLVRNFSPGGTSSIVNDTPFEGVLNISLADVVGDFMLTSSSTIGIVNFVQSTQGDITIVANSGGINVQSTVRAPAGSVSLEATGQIVQRGGNLIPPYLLSGGRNYSYAIVTVDPPPGAGDPALIFAVIEPYAGGDGVTGKIVGLELLNSGWGYPSASRVNITIEGDGEGAAAVADTTIVTSSIEAGGNVTLRGGDSITLVSAVRSTAGSVDIAATLGDVSVQSITAGKAVDVTAQRGKVTLVTVEAGETVDVGGDQGVRISGAIHASTGDIAIDSAVGDLDFANRVLGDGTNKSVVSAPGGNVVLESRNGAILSPYAINAGKNVQLTSLLQLEAANEITSQDGDILLTSRSGRIALSSNLVAETGSIAIESQTSVFQEARSGITSVELLSAGQVSDEAPQVTVTVARPRAGGGRAATVAALIERRQLSRSGFIGGGIGYEYFIGSLVVLDPGEGYEVGEQPLVTIVGVDGALGRAYGPTALQMVMAERNITVDAGESVTLVSRVHSRAGGVRIGSKTGNLYLTSDTVLVSAAVGAIDIVADRGSVAIERAAGGGDVTIDALQGVSVENNLYSESGKITVVSRNETADVRNLNAGNGVTVTGFNLLKFNGEVTAREGDISARSSTGGIRFNSNLVSEQGGISLQAQTFVLQEDWTGIEQVRVISRGSVIQAAGSDAPTVTITIAAPRGGRGGSDGRGRVGQTYGGQW